MKAKLKKTYIKRIEGLRKYARGWPLEIIIADRHPRFHEEQRHYKAWDSYARTKKGRLDGSYEYFFDKKPSRPAHGHC